MDGPKGNSVTVGQQSIIVVQEQKNTYPSFPNWKKEESRYLWLHVESVCKGSRLSSSRRTHERTMKNSWFSVDKVEVRPEVKQSLPLIFSNQQLPTEKEELRVIKYRLYLNKYLKKTLIKWFHCTRWVYNKCVQWSKDHPGVNVSLKVLRDYTSNTSHSPTEMQFLSEVPYEVKDSAVRDFHKALGIQKKLVLEGKRKFFNMKFRSKRDIQSLGIPHKYLKLEGQEIKCFPRFLGKNRFKCRERIK